MPDLEDRVADRYPAPGEDPALAWLHSDEATAYERHWVALDAGTGAFLGTADAARELRVWQSRGALVVYVDPPPDPEALDPLAALEARVSALEAAVAQLVQPEPDFMDHVQADTLHGTNHLTVRLTHLPTGTIVVARDRAEGVYKLRKALADRARREYDLQEKRRRADRRAAADAT